MGITRKEALALILLYTLCQTLLPVRKQPWEGVIILHELCLPALTLPSEITIA
jgi:hypothetical protein